jgi:LysM repeat protein
MRRKLSRTHWAARLLGVPVPHGHNEAPGLIMIQIDGLSRPQFEKALAAGNLPHLARSLKRGQFHLHSFYSGVPSTTPAVQGELFYGVRAAVPAFQFLHRESGEVFRMYDAKSSEVIEKGLDERGGEPLLEGGHTYSNIYRAGAAGSWYCSQDLSPAVMWRKARPFRWLVLSLVYVTKILRVLALVIIEFFLAWIDCVRGLFEKQNLGRELLFIPARVGICIMLREFIRFRVLLDIERGVRVIHANFLGYDEQAHRRGPDSAFAHWTLKDIPVTARAVILDCCRTGAPKATASLAGTTKNFGDIDARVKTALGKAIVPDATLVAFAASPGRKAAAFLKDNDTNSPFTRFLCDELATGGGDLLALVGRAGKTTRTRTENRQIPYTNYVGDLAAIQEIVFHTSSIQHPPAPAVNLPPTTVPVPANAKYHRIQRGDSYGRIAETYSITMDEIRCLNPNLDPARIPVDLEVGQYVRVR